MRIELSGARHSLRRVYEAAVRYLGWEMYYHNQPEV